jgi:hypothetical protein
MSQKDVKDIIRKARHIGKTESAFKLAYWVTDEEGEILYNIAKDNNISLVFESGTANGFSSCWFAGTGATVYTFDIVSRPKIWAKSKELETLSSLINTHVVPFKDGISKVIPKDRKANAIFFLDGGHGYMDIKQEWDAIEPILVSGDHVILHDIMCMKRVAKFWRRILEDNKPNLEFKVITTPRGIGHISVKGTK